jgi:hypothetical protein
VPTPLGYSGQRAADVQPPPRRASDSDAWLVMAACMPYAVPVETVVRAPALAPAKDTRPPDANTASELRAVRDRLQGLAADPANPVPADGGDVPADPTA